MAINVQDHIYMLKNDVGETVASRLLVDGKSILLESDHPCIPRLNCGPMKGSAVQFYSENNEIESGVQVKDYHYFLDQNNKVITLKDLKV